MRGIGRIAVWLVAALVALALLGCDQAPTSPVVQTEDAVLASEVASLQAQVSGLQTMLTNDPGRPVESEPAGPVSNGRFMGLIESITTQDAVIDFVGPDQSDEFSLYRDDQDSPQHLTFADGMVVTVVGQEWAGPYMLAPARVSPVVVPLGEFVERFGADAADGPLHVAYYLVVIDGEIAEIEQVYYP